MIKSQPYSMVIPRYGSFLFFCVEISNTTASSRSKCTLAGSFPATNISSTCTQMFTLPIPARPDLESFWMTCISTNSEKVIVSFWQTFLVWRSLDYKHLKSILRFPTGAFYWIFGAKSYQSHMIKSRPARWDLESFWTILDPQAQKKFLSSHPKLWTRTRVTHCRQDTNRRIMLCSRFEWVQHQTTTKY